jgi:hypothetical protein
MRLPNFGAAAAVGPASRSYRGRYRYDSFARSQSGQPAVELPDELIGDEEEAGLANMDDLAVADEMAMPGDEEAALEDAGDELDDEELDSEEEQSA